MLKINTIDSDNEVRIVVYGKLFEPWVSELRTVWLDKQKTLENRKFVVDLREITAIDVNGIELLSKMFKAGARFLTAGVMTKHLVDSFRKRKEK
jgi:hypothetical protein